MLPAYAMPFQGFVGGLMIGLAAALMLLGLGRIAGVSGLAARASGLSATGTPRAIAAAFVVGLPLGALILEIMGADVPARFPDMATLITGGLIVGFGTRLGSGCTSGHGVCGLARFSPRSVVATATFMATGIATVAAMNALGLGW
ncbi:MAG: hypothetical protein COC10_04455 [Sphingobium sp.]|nr:MAG: hypothetical protein COC10_04455 [Sphingobium sp.]